MRVFGGEASAVSVWAREGGGASGEGKVHRAGSGVSALVQERCGVQGSCGGLRGSASNGVRRVQQCRREEAHGGVAGMGCCSERLSPCATGVVELRLSTALCVRAQDGFRGLAGMEVHFSADRPMAQHVRFGFG